MNISIIRYLLGKVLLIEGALLLFPLAMGIFYREELCAPYALCSIGLLLLGFLTSVKKPSSTVFYLKEGCLTTALSWILLSVGGALPLWLTREIPHYHDALFEVVSGFTTTGASILPEVESLCHASLFWRSFTHWIGGMGVLVFLLAIVPLSGGSNINLMRAESPGPSVGKLVPKIRSTATILYGIYFGLTLIQFILLVAFGMPVFDSLCTALGTAGTGGFGIKNDSIAGYSVPVQWIVTIFMILFGVNFNAYYFMIFHQAKKALHMEEVRWYLLIILASIAAIAVNIRPLSSSWFHSITDAAFQVGSIITTTGFSTVNFDLWPTFSKAILVLLMFVGACAGSTGGGIKVSRFVLLFKTINKELLSFIHPKSIKKIKMDEKPVDHEVMRSTNVYVITFILIFVISALLVSLEGKDLVTTFTSVAATFNNIGPGLALVGPVENFGHMSVLSKFVLMFDMLAGRLELFPMLILLTPTIWKQAAFSLRQRLFEEKGR
ncbi:MAG: TrkH family potassium uptake protein [Lachnospiraceae bacterium]|nr:TrkH family potassium uptake protein [Lachnospiraceae bacterium]